MIKILNWVAVVLIMEELSNKYLLLGIALDSKPLTKLLKAVKLTLFGNVQSPLGPEAKPVEKHLAHTEPI